MGKPFSQTRFQFWGIIKQSNSSPQSQIRIDFIYIRVTFTMKQSTLIIR